MTITYRQLGIADTEHYREIDRSELIEEVYYLREGLLVLEPERYDMKGFPPEELERLITRQKAILAAGGTVFGGFDGEILVGIASIEGRLRGGSLAYVNMDVLHVSAAYRGRGIASRLVELVAQRARETGGKRLYISATESRQTVDFYRARGATLATWIDPDLFAKEPRDIHMEIRL